MTKEKVDKEKVDKEKVDIEFKEYVEIFIHWQLLLWSGLISLLTGFGIPLLINLALHFQNPNSNSLAIMQTIVYNLPSTIIIWIISLMALSIPQYCIKKLGSITRNVDANLREHAKTIKESIAPIQNCPKMIALHSDGKLEKAIGLLNDNQFKSNHRWILSKYISKLISESIEIDDKDAKLPFVIDPKKYSTFSSELFSDAKDSVILSGSIHPITWLEKVTTDEKILKKIINNECPIDQFKYDEKNHAIILKDSMYIKKRIRYVCLNDFDFRYLFIAEKSVDLYFHINDPDKGFKTYFVNENDLRFAELKPMIYEYALYDDKLLLRWELKKQELTLILENQTGTAESEFAEMFKFDLIHTKRQYEDIKKQIIADKIKVLKDIKTTQLIPHKLCYLYDEGKSNWIEFVRNSDSIYSDSGTSALTNALLWWKDTMDDGQIEILDVGSGDGCRISTICDSLGSKKIKTYLLLDISQDLLNVAYDKLKATLSSTSQCPAPMLLDCSYKDTDNINRLRRIVNDKYVFILLNSTLFTEDKFNISHFARAEKIYILLDKPTNNSLEQQLKGKELFLNPLKMFEIPIDLNILDDFQGYLFSEDYDTKTYYFNIVFNLKLYIGILRGDTIDNNNIAEYNIVEKERMDSSVKMDPSDFLREYGRHRTYPKYEIIDPINKLNLAEYKEYYNLRADFFTKTDLKVLSSLKFKNTTDAESYFGNKGFVVQANEYENFISICLSKNT